jgi:hypothetical protein
MCILWICWMGGKLQSNCATEIIVSLIFHINWKCLINMHFVNSAKQICIYSYLDPTKDKMWRNFYNKNLIKNFMRANDIQKLKLKIKIKQMTPNTNKTIVIMLGLPREPILVYIITLSLEHHTKEFNITSLPKVLSK